MLHARDHETVGNQIIAGNQSDICPRSGTDSGIDFYFAHGEPEVTGQAITVLFEIIDNFQNPTGRNGKSRFNAAVAEVGSNDKWQMIELGITTVGNDRQHMDSSLNHILSFLDSMGLAQLVDSEMEILNV